MAIGASKLTEQKVQIIRDLLKTGDFTHKQIGEFFGVSREHITSINTGNRWNEETKTFIMKSNDFRQFTEPIRNKKKHGITITLSDGTKLEF